MKILKTTEETKKYLRSMQKAGKTIGFVPTMGYLHEGHLSLIQKSLAENDITVVSIFVNPTQFGPGEDFERYPRDLDKDINLVEQAGGHVIFNPDVTEMYPEGYKTYVSVEALTENLCGTSRPGHFKGVTTVVNKLFNIVHPDNAYFGQKDAQQAIIIRQMTKDLNMDIEVKICPIIRETDGLAMSSRNVYLKPEERSQAIILYKALNRARNMIYEGERNAAAIIDVMIKMIESQPLALIDYVKIVSGLTLKDIELLKGNILIAVAVKFGNTRLIDNIMLEVN